MDGFWSSVSSWWGEKTNSPLYFTYLGFLVVWNWKFFQVVFLESPDLFVAPRIEYIKSTLLFSVPIPESIPFWVSSLVDWLSNLSWHIGPPIFFTFLAIVYLPRLNALAFDIHLNNYFARKNSFRNANLVYEKGETARLKEEVVEKKQQQVQKKAIEKAKTEDEKWDDEFLENEKVLDESGFSILLTIIYDKTGHITDPMSGRLIVSKTAVAFADSFGLIQFNDPRNRITLTEKGKYFSKKFLKNNRLY